jgi:methyl-accepting chemotaxis protein
MLVKTQLNLGGMIFAALVGAYCTFVILSQDKLAGGFSEIIASSETTANIAATVSDEASETSTALSGRAKGFVRLIDKAKAASGGGLESREALEHYFTDTRKIISELEDIYLKLPYNDGEYIKVRFEALEKLHQEALEKGMAPLQKSVGAMNYLAKALNINVRSLTYIADKITSISDEIGALKDSSEETQQNALTFSESIGKTKTVLLLAAVPLVLGVLLGSFYTSSRLTRPLQTAVHTASAIADGNLGIEVQHDPTRKDEFGKLLGSMVKMRDKLREDIALLARDADSISRGVGIISNGNIQLADRTRQQREDLETTSRSSSTLTEAVRQNAADAQQARALSASALELASKGGNVVEETIVAMENINAVSEEMADIISIIEEISFQTNLLALNASVEAARAGDQGKGFAVVAGEVRNLAQKSADSANQIRDLIDNSRSKVATGRALAGQSGEALELIMQQVREVDSVISRIVASSDEQLEWFEGINTSVIRLGKGFEENQALSEETQKSSARLQTQTESMRSRVEYFKLDEEHAA